MGTSNRKIQRAFWHDYRSPGRYMITLSKAPGVPSLSTIEGDWRLPVGAPGASYTHWSPIGQVIANQIYHISNIHPALRAEQYVVMPDHVHILLNVQAPLPEHLGFFIARLKNAVNVASGLTGVFEEGFNDQIVTNKRDLDTLYRYIRSNPYRLAVRRANPDFFTRINALNIDGKTYMAYGNMHLLSNPFKEQVVVHRADTPEMFRKNKERWLYVGGNGGVLVSPFISPAEKAVRAEAETLWAPTILITHDAFPPRYKPSAHDFDLCSPGRLLILTLGYPAGTTLSRPKCIEMKELAERLARA